ncbi:DUF6804 family protein [Spirosoma spitsbergense]|jgi:hypothetical protein|uniref:DUF6804 family protein n=1 Tax=Spirosoma spitsbergense TaxID=431554 RepID=UPI00037B2EE4|nr:DUF6804 family protein [Spirosoma spitsbergense]
MRIYSAILFVSAGLLFLATLAVLSLPYGYFTFLRIVVCSTAVYAAIRLKDSTIPFLALLMVAILFNPLIPVYLPKLTWRIIDLAVAAAFIRLALKSLNTQDSR